MPEPPTAELDAARPDPAIIGPAPAAAGKAADRPAPPHRRRRWYVGPVLLPVALFLLTCGSTFFAGATRWTPLAYSGDLFDLDRLNAALAGDLNFLLGARGAVLSNWRSGLAFMASLLAILLTHEMGHFLMAMYYRLPATLPLFVPLPVSPIGTMGAVIIADGTKPDRRQIFDFGLAGPLAGLVVAVPVLWVGAARLDLSSATPGSLAVELPWAMRVVVEHLHPGVYRPGTGVPLDAMNPYFMAGWVGLLVTALNMMPVSQLDGGHVTYALFGRGAHALARLFILFTFLYLSIGTFFFGRVPFWILMALVVFLIGTDHPPTRDDDVPLGWFRWGLGLASLLIPVFCFTPNPFRI